MWYEAFREEETEFEKGSECFVDEYFLNPDGSLSVLATYFDIDKGEVKVLNGSAKCDDSDCKIKFFSFMPFADYQIVSTDYSEYAIVYSCADIFGIAKLEYLRILSRRKVIKN